MNKRIESAKRNLTASLVETLMSLKPELDEEAATYLVNQTVNGAVKKIRKPKAIKCMHGHLTFFGKNEGVECMLCKMQWRRVRHLVGSKFITILIRQR